MAEREKFLIVAPDSRIAPNGLVTWEVPTEPGERTEDWDHVRRCVDELRSIAGVSVDAARTLIVGFSGGGSTAPYVASVDDFYTAFAVLHGGVFVGGLGPRRVRGWLSTGDADSWRPPSQVRESAERVRRLGFGSIVYRVYHEGHELRAEEVEELVEWWLHP
jgi:poly(3-hydroxybutyrate) depolymerase